MGSIEYVWIYVCGKLYVCNKYFDTTKRRLWSRADIIVIHAVWESEMEREQTRERESERERDMERLRESKQERKREGESKQERVL